MKRFAVFSLAILMALTLTACGSSAGPQAYRSAATTEGAYYDNGYAYDMAAAEAPAAEPEEMAESPAGAGNAGGEYQPQTSRKLIKNVWLSLEALEFDQMVAGVQNKVEQLGGYIESSNVSGNSVNYKNNRYASITARVPADKLDEFVAEVEGMGNITNRQENVQDVTLTYVDMEARVKSLTTEYDRLMELLAQAENLESIIALEQRLTEVRYEMESYQSQLRTYDNLVDYSTVNVDIDEVERITPAAEKGVWERISTEFGENLYSVGVGLTDFFVWFVANIPYLLVWAAVIALLAFIVIRIIKGGKHAQERRAAKRAEKERKRLEKLQARQPQQPEPQPEKPDDGKEN